MLRQNKFISIISIAGTAFAVMLVMVVVIIDRIGHVSVAPEDKRELTVYAKHQLRKNEEKKSMNSSWINYPTYKGYLKDLKTPEVITFISITGEKSNIKNVENKKKVSAVIALTDQNYWKIISHSFLEGQPFNKMDSDGGAKYAVISKSKADELFGKRKATGKEIEIEFQPYKVIGVVDDVSPVFKFAFADIWIPVTSTTDPERQGGFVLFLAKNKKEFNAISEEVRTVERKLDLTYPDWKHIIFGPYPHHLQVINNASNIPPDLLRHTITKYSILTILILIPMLNLSGFSRARMRKRIPEIGVRKAFGARKHTILIHVLYENMITSLIGGFIGLLCSYSILIVFKEWLLGTAQLSMIPFNILISIPILIIVFLLSLIVNLLSAGIPAFRASKVSIVDSLKKNDF